MDRLKWNEHSSLVRVRRSTVASIADRQLIAEGSLFAVCQLILGMTGDQLAGLAIHFPEKRMSALHEGSDDFSLLLSNARSECERLRARSSDTAGDPL